MQFASALFSYLGEFVVFKLQSVAYIDTKWQQGNGNFGNHPGIVIFDISVVAANINNGTEHSVLL